jgi:predicted GNAT family N-acyltransferase
VIEIRLADGQAEVDAALELRRRVYCEEQGVSLEADRDGLDAEAIHVVAVEHGSVIGTCRLVLGAAGARLGRMAVERGERRRGVGAAMLQAAEREACTAGATRIELHAQTRVRALYERAGYAPAGTEYLDEGIPHVPTEKALA